MLSLGVQHVAVAASTLHMSPNPPAAKADVFKESSPLLSMWIVALTLNHNEGKHAQHHVRGHGCHEQRNKNPAIADHGLQGKRKEMVPRN